MKNPLAVTPPIIFGVANNFCSITQCFVYAKLQTDYYNCDESETTFP